MSLPVVILSSIASGEGGTAPGPASPDPPTPWEDAGRNEKHITISIALINISLDVSDWHGLVPVPGSCARPVACESWR